MKKGLKRKDVNNLGMQIGQLLLGIYAKNLALLLLD